MGITKHYEINNNTKTISANMGILNDKDLKIIKNYVAIGYTLNPIEPEKKVVKIATDEERAKNPYSAVNIQKYLEEEGTDKQKADYWKLYNAPLKNNACYQKDSKDGKHKAGEPRFKGHVGTLKWFKESFPDYLTSEWVKNNIKA